MDRGGFVRRLVVIVHLSIRSRRHGNRIVRFQRRRLLSGNGQNAIDRPFAELLLIFFDQIRRNVVMILLRQIPGGQIVRIGDRRVTRLFQTGTQQTSNEFVVTHARSGVQRRLTVTIDDVRIDLRLMIGRENRLCQSRIVSFDR